VLLVRVAYALAIAAGSIVAVGIGWLWYDSRLPAGYGVMEYGAADYGSGVGAGASEHDHAGHVSVTRLTETATGAPDVRVRLTAGSERIRLPSGRTIDALAFNGRVPGPELRLRQGALVEVTLVNRDVEDGVSVHWHGLDVPNAVDGVSGVTQDAVMPGRRHVYRFRAEQAGTYWYHSHQHSSTQVRRGLYGAIVVLPRRRPARRTLDLTAVSHTFPGARTLGASDGVTRKAVAAGTPVRLRLVNSDSNPMRFVVAGSPFRVVAIDGTDLHAPPAIAGRTLEVAAGGRYDVAFTMPRTPVEVATLGGRTAFVFSRDGRGDVAVPEELPLFDPATYGRPRAEALANARFDRTFVLDIGRKIGFVDGRPGYHWTINGKLFPDVPTFVVGPGDLVKVVIANDSGADHPMHLHGHHMLVLSRDGLRVSGSPWWVDTLNVLPGEEYEVAFRADNRGLWMLHCHNLGHAADGLTMHLAYEGVSTPFRIGKPAGNRPE
jgi:FtsP/CotA-like multicopper oxidase with cupredoxin domain